MTTSSYIFTEAVVYHKKIAITILGPKLFKTNLGQGLANCVLKYGSLAKDEKEEWVSG